MKTAGTRAAALILILSLSAVGCATAPMRETGTAPPETGHAGAVAERSGTRDPQDGILHEQENYNLMLEVRNTLVSGRSVEPEKVEELVGQIPDSSYGRYLAGFIYMQSGNTDEAVNQFKRSSELDPQNEDALSALGQMALEAGDLAQADLYFLKAHQASDTPATANRLALLRIRGGYVESAREILERSLETHPDDVMTRNNLAAAMDLLGTTSGGIEVLTGEGISDHRLLQTRALLQLKEGRPEQAVRDLEIVAEGGKYGSQWLLLGIADLQRGSLDGAEDKFRSAISEEPSDHEGYLNLGLTLRRQGKFVEAAKVYKEGLTRSPHPDLHLNLGVLYELYRGEPTLALEQYRRYLDLEGPASERVRGWVEYLEGVLERQ